MTAKKSNLPTADELIPAIKQAGEALLKAETIGFTERLIASIKLGELLEQAKERERARRGHGHWDEWLKKHLPELPVRSKRMVNRCMRYAKNKEKLIKAANPPRVAEMAAQNSLSLRDADALLRKPKLARPPPPKEATPTSDPVEVTQSKPAGMSNPTKVQEPQAGNVPTSEPAVTTSPPDEVAASSSAPAAASGQSEPASKLPIDLPAELDADGASISKLDQDEREQQVVRLLKSLPLLRIPRVLIDAYDDAQLGTISTQIIKHLQSCHTVPATSDGGPNGGGGAQNTEASAPGADPLDIPPELRRAKDAAARAQIEAEQAQHKKAKARTR
jgi:hypothetical protein